MNRWKPEVGEIYYFPLIHGEVGGPMPASWEDSEVDNERYEMGVVCRTQSETVELARKMLAVANDIPLTAYRHVYDNGRIKCPKCSKQFIWGYYDSEAYDEIHHCPYCGQRINVVDTEE